MAFYLLCHHTEMTPCMFNSSPNNCSLNKQVLNVTFNCITYDRQRVL
uniref:Uncharacterized protein n=1 Tax=Rhizophora mucronata TaxID=61149 RepID=A0A2P2PBX7_RHIMU